MLRIGLQLPQWGDGANREGLLSIATAAEAAGLDSVWVSDHVVYPLTGEAAYPYSSGGPPFKPDDGYLEALTTLAVIAGATNRIRLGTSVLILPMREVLLSAKMIATLDVLSGGRTTVAVAAGWWRAEFDALGVAFDTRGQRLDEQLEALAALWTAGRHEMTGSEVRFPPVVVEPRPIQAGGPELWIGGRGPRVWRRIANSAAAGWHGIGHRPEVLEEARKGLERACLDAGRDPASVRYSTATGMPADAQRLLSRLQSLSELGFSQVVLIPREDRLTSILEAIAQFAQTVRPRLA